MPAAKCSASGRGSESTCERGDLKKAMPVKKTTTAKTTSSKATATPKATVTSKAKVAPLEEAAIAAAPASVAEPKKPRTTATRRKKVDAPVAVVMTEEQIREEICRVAYGYWVERNYAPGDPMMDWLRAEAEVRIR